MKNNNISLPRFDEFLLNLQTSNYSEETIYNYERDINVFANFLNELNVEFDKITKSTILNYKAYLVSRDRKTAKDNLGEKKLGSYSINRMLSSLRSYFRFLIDMDYDIPVPPESIKLMKTEKKHPQVAELELLKKSNRQHRKNFYYGQREKRTVCLFNRTCL